MNQGGSDALQNLAPVCRSCNSRKGDRHPEQLRRILARQQKGILWSAEKMKLLRAGGVADSAPGESFKFYHEIVGVYEV